MSIFIKFKEMAKKSVSAVETGLDNTVKKIKEDGLEAMSYQLGRQVGTMVHEVKENVTDYAQGIEKANKKAINPLGISFKKGTPSYTTAKAAVAAINTMRIVGIDVKNKASDIIDKIEAQTKKPTI